MGSNPTFGSTHSDGSPKLVASAGTTHRWQFDNENLFNSVASYCRFYNAAHTLLSQLTLHTSPVHVRLCNRHGRSVAPSGTAYMTFNAEGAASYDNVCLKILGG